MNLNNLDNADIISILDSLSEEKMNKDIEENIKLFLIEKRNLCENIELPIDNFIHDTKKSHQYISKNSINFLNKDAYLQDIRKNSKTQESNIFFFLSLLCLNNKIVLVEGKPTSFIDYFSKIVGIINEYDKNLISKALNLKINNYTVIEEILLNISFGNYTEVNIKKFFDVIKKFKVIYNNNNNQIIFFLFRKKNWGILNIFLDNISNNFLVQTHNNQNVSFEVFLQKLIDIKYPIPQDIIAKVEKAIMDYAIDGIGEEKNIFKI